MINRMREARGKARSFLWGVDGTFLPIACYVALAMFWPFTPLGDTSLRSFDRRIGVGIAQGYDSAAAYQNLTVYLLGMAFLFGALLCFFHWYGNCRFGRWLKEANQISGCLIWPMLVDYISIFAREDSTLNYYPLFARAFLLMLLWETVIHGVFKTTPEVCGNTGILSKLCGAIGVALASSYFLDMSDPILWVAVYSAAYLVLSVLKITRFSHLDVYIVWVPAAMTLCVEGFYILNQWEIYVVRQRAAGMLLFALLVTGTFFVCRKWNFAHCGETTKEMVLCSGLLTSMVMVAYRPQLVNVMPFVKNGGLFEIANNLHMLDGLLNWGKIPLVETFSAHTLSDMAPDLVWKILNGPSASMVGAYTGWFVGLGVLVLFALFSRYVRPFAAFIVLALGGTFLAWKFAPFGILLLFLVIKRQSMPRYLIYWTGLAVVLLYQLDYGLMFGLASLITFLLLALFKKIPVDAKKFWGAGALVTVLGLALALFVCLVKGISPISRLREFLEVSLGSNPIWALPSVGNPANAAMFWAYVATPLVAIGAVVWMLWTMLKGRQVEVSRWAGIMVLFIGVLINLNRTMVRHNILEGGNVIASGGVIFAVALLLYEVKGHRTWIFLSVSMVTLVMTQTLVRGYLVADTSYNTIAGLADCSASVMTLPEEQAPVKVERMVMNIDEKVEQSTMNTDSKLEQVGMRTGQEIEQVKAFMDLLLEEDESYVDFSNQSALYALIGRESPFYVSEVPGLLTGEYSQQCYIDQIEQKADSLPLALTAGDVLKDYNFELDGIPLNVRYYKIVEYLCNHYQPLLKWNKYAIWVRTDAYESTLKKLEKAGDQIPVEYTLCDYTNSTYQPTYAYQKLALIWAEQDEKKAVENPVVLDCGKNENGYYDIRLDRQAKQDGNYLKVSVYSEIDTGADLVLMNENAEVLCRFTFQISQGTHDYLLRISGYPGWYSDQTFWAKMESVEPIEITGMQVLQGD